MSHNLPQTLKLLSSMALLVGSVPVNDPSSKFQLVVHGDVTSPIASLFVDELTFLCLNGDTFVECVDASWYTWHDGDKLGPEGGSICLSRKTNDELSDDTTQCVDSNERWEVVRTNRQSDISGEDIIRLQEKAEGKCVVFTDNGEKLGVSLGPCDSDNVAEFMWHNSVHLEDQEQKVSGGVDAALEGHEWVGRLEVAHSGCTVSLINPEWVLTASHCVTKQQLKCKSADCMKDNILSDAKVYLNTIGAMYSDDTGETRSVDYISIPDGSATGDLKKDDMALLHLDRPVRLNYYPKLSKRHWNGDFSVLGFGHDGTDTMPRLQIGEHIRQVSCEDGYVCYDRRIQQPLSEHGDSGGPVYYEDGGEQVLIATVYGTISHTVGANTDIVPHMPWIESLMNGGKVDCAGYCKMNNGQSTDSVSLCDTNRYTRCADICRCESERPPEKVIQAPTSSMDVKECTAYGFDSVGMTAIQQMKDNFAMGEPTCDEMTGSYQNMIDMSNRGTYFDPTVGEAHAFPLEASCVQDGFKDAINKELSRLQRECRTATTAQPPSTPTATPAATPIASSSAAATPISTPSAAATPIATPTGVGSAQTAECDIKYAKAGDTQATVQWSNGYKYLDCTGLDSLHQTLMDKAPKSNICIRQAFLETVEQQYAKQQAACGNELTTSSTNTQPQNQNLITCGMKWQGRDDKPSCGSNLFQTDKQCCKYSHQCGTLAKCNASLCCAPTATSTITGTAPTSSCDSRYLKAGETQATVQWSSGYKYLDCTQLEHFHQTLASNAPSSNACIRQGFLSTVEQQYMKQQSACGSTITTGSANPQPQNLNLITCGQKWQGRSDKPTCASFKPNEQCCKYSHKCGTLDKCKSSVCCA